MLRRIYKGITLSWLGSGRQRLSLYRGYLVTRARVPILSGPRGYLAWFEFPGHFGSPDKLVFNVSYCVKNPEPPHVVIFSQTRPIPLGCQARGLGEAATQMYEDACERAHEIFLH